MSLITDPLYLIHISRIKFLRMDERGERIITFPPTVMSDDYVRLAAPIYPEMQYCYSPVYDSLLNENTVNLTSSPRTTKRTYRARPPALLNKPLPTIPQQRLPNPVMTPTMMSTTTKAQETDSEDDDIEIEDKQALFSGSGKPEEALTSPISAQPQMQVVSHRSFPFTSLHPSVDSAIDPSPSFEETTNPTFNGFPVTPHDTDTIEASIPTSVATLDEPLFKKLDATKHPAGSALSALIAEKATAAENPFAEYAFVSGKGEPKSITLCVYLPHSNQPYTPVSLIVRPDAITDDVIGYILYDYVEQKREPELDESAYDLAEWVLLIAEDDGEIEDDLPAVDRTRNIGRVSFDQFALCRATPSQAKQNDLDRAKMGRSKPDLETLHKKRVAAQQTLPAQHHTHLGSSTHTNMNDHIPPYVEGSPILHMPGEEDPASQPSSEPTLTHLLPTQQQPEPDASTVAVPVPSSKATLTKATMPMTPLKYFRIKLMTNEEVSATTAIPVYAEMFIGDVLELVSRKRKLDPNEYMLTIADSNVIVSNDTTVESMKGITDLTLTKKGTTLSIPTTSHSWRSPIKRKKEEGNHPMYFSTTESSPTAGPSTTNANDTLLSQYKKYTVSRKMPMFVSKRVYIMAIDGDYIHLMPPEHKGMFDSVKTTSFHASAVRSCKQSKKVPTNFKVIILKERDFKTYDLEAESTKEASEICGRIRFLMQVTKGI
ncbi:stress-activated map kinase interacting protein 1-domain-containing protein [Gilbertella persicaria]|uniref:stress-activated map kinase interacting protein 1-domain-containing protein n=1 Tax=Gilbertella persicaria TaxID=101096 RepID=UPI0022205C07|nr:stress-activated map kinase interacting protein 1-domain-containing protein [Gilbertella persicaria]KAI8083989.1 stress-activated map kinase interacting protein 1-domain-containing protein [Gilbertella persicaria]